MSLLAVIAFSSFTFTLYYFRQKRKTSETNRKLALANIRIQQYLNAVDASNLVCVSTPDGKFKYINSQYLEVLGYTFDELIGQTYYMISHPGTEPGTYEKLFKTVSDGNIWSGMIKNLTKSGETIYLETSVVPILNEDNAITEYMSIRKDVTQIVRQQALIKSQLTDPLTGYPNRTQMLKDLQSIATPSLAILNIDSFSTINAFYGLDAGDEILIQFSKLLNSMLTSDMSMYRLSGDEFAILAAKSIDIKDFNILISSIIHELTEHKFIYHDNDIMLNLTAGTAGSADGHDDLLVKAGMAIKQARSGHKNLTTYEDVKLINDQLKETIQYSSALRDAVKKDRIVPHFRPLLTLTQGDSLSTRR